ncbi:MAG: dihydroorotate dehydrogenase electron transfer subunit [Gammaproteobacteria bacterium]|nr:dihydroorotate dehydrogenase electron transfer subunit [Gammaproteobacteria bacterium]
MNGAFDHSHRARLIDENAEILAVGAYPGAQHTLRVKAPEIAARAGPGTFVHLRCEPAMLMRRPMSIMRADPGTGIIDILYKAQGAGTRALAQRQVGEHLKMLGPIGQSFKLEGYRRRPLLIGGGVGIPPMIYLAEHLKRVADVRPLVLMGSEVPFPFSPRPSQLMVPGMPAAVIAALPLLEDWGIACRLASLQGYAGCFEGYVTELAATWIEASGVPREDVEIFACGPTPMLKAVQALAARLTLPAELSLEENMACAVGGCAGCTVRIETPQGSAMKRVCVDGPVFAAATIIF